jgi:hypothetical protein
MCFHASALSCGKKAIPAQGENNYLLDYDRRKFSNKQYQTILSGNNITILKIKLSYYLQKRIFGGSYVLRLEVYK